jgi:hypothetical protein
MCTQIVRSMEEESTEKHASFHRLVHTYFSLFRKSTQLFRSSSALTGRLTELNEFDNRRFCKVRSIRIGEGTKNVLGMVKNVSGVPTFKRCAIRGPNRTSRSGRQ